MAREQDRLTLLFAHLQTLPGEDPSLPWVWTRAGALYTHMASPGSQAESRIFTKGLQVRKMGQGEAGGWMWGGRGMDVDTPPVPISEEEAEGIGGLSPAAEPALLWAPVVG